MEDIGRAFEWAGIGIIALEGIGALGLLVVVRTILSFSIDVEVNGVLPWRAGPVVSDGPRADQGVGRGVHGRDEMRGS